MIKDPLTVWNGQFPYDALAPAGIGPQSSQEEVEQASFTLMAARLMNPVTQKAWHELRDPQRRLVADFLLYDIDPRTELAQARERIRQELADPGPAPAAEPPCLLTEDFVDSLIHFDR